MEMKRFEMKRKLASTKDMISGLVRAIGVQGHERSAVSRSAAVPKDSQYEPLNLLTNYTLYHEIGKAEGIDAWRRWHDKPR